MAQFNVLLVEDHRDIAEMVGEYLESKDYVIDYAADGISGLRLGTTNDYDAIVLDVMLPGLDGLDVVRQLRDDAGSKVPVLMLTARDTLADKLSGFEHGADDYLVKPFDLEELEARVAALIRRDRRAVTSDCVEVAGVRFDTATMQVSRNGIEIVLTPIGLKILHLLMRASPRIVARHDIEREIWGDIPPDSDALRSHMYSLRKALDKPFDCALIHTVHSAGFRFGHEN